MGRKLISDVGIQKKKKREREEKKKSLWGRSGNWRGLLKYETDFCRENMKGGSGGGGVLGRSREPGKAAAGKGGCFSQSTGEGESQTQARGQVQGKGELRCGCKGGSPQLHQHSPNRLHLEA